MGADDEAELLLCPVWALQVFLQQYKASHRSRIYLFLSVSLVEVSLNTFSFWLRAVIPQAYEAAGLDPQRLNPHKIRAVASTMDLYSNCSIMSIMEGCFWRSNTIFASHYPHDVALEEVATIHSLDPLVAA